MQVSVVVPVYNEERTVAVLLRRVLAAGMNLREVLVIDDGSSDATRERVKEVAAADPRVRLIAQPQNMGKGAAVRTGFEAAKGEIILVQDADLEYDPAELPRLLQPIYDGLAEVVFGSRFIGGGAHRVHLFWHMVANQVLTLLSNMCTNLNLTDMECCYKAFKREVLADIHLEEERFGFEPEITAKVARKKVRVYEVGVSYFGRSYAEGKKIRALRDGMRALYCIIVYSFFR
ncbi:MAG: glycosyltransferase family 2 protein [Opitutales bacterium]|jgi:glycosyltransferase involved in cell wall biosynthesis